MRVCLLVCLFAKLSHSSKGRKLNILKENIEPEILTSI